MTPRPYLSQIDSQIPDVEIAKSERAVFILHDQLNLNAWPSWIRKEKPLLIFIESGAKGKSLPYHKKKLIFLLSSMRHFALECAEAGFPVHYHSTQKHYDGGLTEILYEHEHLQLSYMTPSEWDSRERLRNLRSEFKGRVKEIPNNFFLADADDYEQRVKDGWLMEYFYREMRRKTGYLMNGENPEGGEWNYDEQNRENFQKIILCLPLQRPNRMRSPGK